MEACTITGLLEAISKLRNCSDVALSTSLLLRDREVQQQRCSAL